MPMCSTPAFTERKPIASRHRGASLPGPERIKVGTCSWTDPTLIESGWYPERIKDDADKRLRYYAEHFPIVENDAAYYALPSQKQTQLRAERTPDEFTMNFKACATLTTHHRDPERPSKYTREALRSAAREKAPLHTK